MMAWLECALTTIVASITKLLVRARSEYHVIPRETIWEIWEVRGILTTRVPANREEAFERVAGLLEVMARDSSEVRGRLL